MQLLPPRPSILSGPIAPQDPPQTPPPSPIPKYRSNLQLSPEREAWLLKEYIIPRIAEVKFEMGLEVDGRVRPGSFLDIRLRNEATYENDLDWRKSIQGSVFSEGHNFTKGTNRRYARLISARVRDDLLGTRPFFGAMTKNEGDQELTHEVEHYVQDRIDDSNVPNALRDGLRLALIRNEAVVKTTYRKEESVFFGPAKVMVSQNGTPMQTPLKKLYIFENDDFIPDPTTEGNLLLEKDPSFSMQDGQYRYQQFPRLRQINVVYDAPDAKVLDPRDFLCPLKVASTHEADINVHLFLANPVDMQGRYAGYDISDRYYRNWVNAVGVRQPRRTQGEEDERASNVLGVVLQAEVYVKVDADEDGEREEIFAVIDMETDEGAFIFYDYTGNHMSRRPFSVIPGIERVPDRWYGVGVFSKMEHNALYIDAQFNRINEKDSQDSSFTFVKRRAVKQWKDGKPIIPGSRQMLEVEDGYDATTNPPAWRTHLQSEAELGTDLMRQMEQAGDQEFGVISASDASASDLNQSKTATGIMSIDRDASVMTKDTEYDHILGIESVLDMAVELTLENMDPVQLKFSKDAQALVALNRDDIRNLKRKVKLLLTKTRSTQMLQMGEKAEAVWLRYMRLSPLEQYHGRDLYVKQLKGLEVDDVDNLLPRVTQQDVQAWQKAQQDAQNQKEQKPVSKTIVSKLTDLAPSERAQVLAQEGITPAAPAELEQKKNEDLATKVAEKEAGKPDPTEKKPDGK